MKNFDRPTKIEKFDYITVVYKPQLEAVKYMFKEHYDKPEYADTLFLINTILWWDDKQNCYHQFNREDFTETRRIYYNLEHAADTIPQEQQSLKEYIMTFGLTEIWTFEPNIENWDCGLIPIKFVPLRYTSLLEKSNLDVEKKFDLGFIGIVGSPGYSPRRNEFFDKYIQTPQIDFSIKILNGFTISELKDELANCKFVLDSKRNYRHSMPNQVRLFEHLCLGHTVLSEKSDMNVFPGMVYEWNDIFELNNLIKTVQPEDMSLRYKEMTYSDDAYLNYKYYIMKTFYTKPTADYFYNNDKPKRSDIINKLIAKNNYKTYLEIGIAGGESFNTINCEYKVGVDPALTTPATHHMTSDEYFDSLTPNDKFDIIFIDGLHLWEQCYRDINNALAHLNPNGVVVCHDMNPLFEMFQSRLWPDTCGLWNGDVWKAFAKVRTERNDINCQMIEDCDFGIGIIRFGNPNPIRINKPAEELYFADFEKNKAVLMNTITLDKFLTDNQL